MKKIVAASLIAALCSAPALDAAPLDTSRPLLEIGAGVSAARIPHYPGSNQSDSRLVPFPYVTYRGKWFKRDDLDGARVQVYNRRLRLDIGFFGAFSLDSSQDNARRGMPDLDWIAAAGPRLVYPLLKPGGLVDLKLVLPVRVNFAVDFPSHHYKGLVAAPALVLDSYNVAGEGSIAFFQTSLQYAGREFSDFYYGVDQAFATANRPAYRAKRGFFGLSCLAGLIAPLPWRLKLVALGGIDDYTAGANAKSPLFKKNLNTWGLIALSYIFWVSDKKEGEDLF